MWFLRKMGHVSNLGQNLYVGPKCHFHFFFVSRSLSIMVVLVQLNRFEWSRHHNHLADYEAPIISQLTSCRFQMLRILVNFLLFLVNLKLCRLGPHTGSCFFVWVGRKVYVRLCWKCIVSCRGKNGLAQEGPMYHTGNSRT